VFMWRVLYIAFTRAYLRGNTYGGGDHLIKVIPVQLHSGHMPRHYDLTKETKSPVPRNLRTRSLIVLTDLVRLLSTPFTSTLPPSRAKNEKAVETCNEGVLSD